MFPGPLIPMKKSSHTMEAVKPASTPPIPEEAQTKAAVATTLAWSATPKEEPPHVEAKPPPSVPIPREDRETPRAEKVTLKQSETDALLSEFLAEEPTTGPRRKKIDPSVPPRRSEPVASEVPAKKRDPRSE
jgi:hypothetical protein